MKILFVAPANSMHTYKWINYFAERGCEVKFISLYGANHGFTQEYPSLKPTVFNWMPFKILNFIAAWLYIQLVIVKFRPDIVHGHTAGSHGLLSSLSFSSRIVTTVWGSDILIAAKKSYIAPFVKFILNRSQRITCDAHHMVEELKKYNLKAGIIKIINFGVDTRILRKLDAESDGFKFKYRGKNNRAVVISLRNHWPIYDIETLIRSAAIVIQSTKDVSFVVAGKGPLTTSYVDLVKKYKLEEYFEFVGGYVGGELPAMFASTDIYVSTSLSDAGIAASTAEAMSCGVPVVISDTGENQMWIDNHRNGLLFPAGDEAVLAEHLLLLLKNKLLASDVGMRGRETIIERNDYINEMNKMVGIYSAVAAHS